MKRQAETAVSFSNPTASEWDKLSSLRQIEMAREIKKHTILEKVLKESLASEQTVEVVTGQPSLVQFLVANPFAEEEVFQVVMTGDDGELRLVHNEGD